MNKITFSSLFFLLSFSLIAQVSGVVKDSLTGKPIPFVNIWVENENIGTNSEIDGSFLLEAKEEKRIIFSALGYETKIIKLSESLNVLLKPKEYELKEVVLKASSKKKQIKVGEFESNGFRYHLNYNYNAVFFKYSEKIYNYPYIKEVKFVSISDIKKATIRIRIVEADTSKIFGKDILMQELIITVKKGREVNKIDLSKFNLVVPENGFYVIFEKLLINENKYCFEYSYKDKIGKKKFKNCSYEPNLAYVPTLENDNLYSMNLTNWKKHLKIELKEPKSYKNLILRKYHNCYLTPAIEITLSN